MQGKATAKGLADMTAGIALLGWGSLLWEGANTFDDWHEPWQCDGPCLTIEFTRVSCSRAGALTLVIDPDNGVPIEVAWCLSRRQTVGEAIEDLRKREQTTRKHIGRIVADGQVQCHDGESRQVILTWVEKRGLAGVVWTDLRSNFRTKRGEPFSIDAAMRYVKCLEGESRTKAFEYFQRAPSFVRTPLRNTFDKEICEIAPSNS
jgi:hypothetical protein